MDHGGCPRSRGWEGGDTLNAQRGGRQLSSQANRYLVFVTVRLRSVLVVEVAVNPHHRIQVFLKNA